MRTGSNLLEDSLNRIEGVQCHGEAFNPVFIAYPDRTDLLGVSQADRDRDPRPLLERIRRQPGLNGFRYFPDHDPRILDEVLDDPACAKIVLSRNPLDSYISLKIARETGQWRLGGPGRRVARVPFDGDEFAGHLDLLAGFHGRILRALQVSGQTAFHLDYDDLGDAGVLAGLARFLGRAGSALPPLRKTLPQNPEPAEEKVTNPAEMAAALARLDPFRLGRPPSFEPRRGPGVPDFRVALGARLLFMPIPGNPAAGITGWLDRIGGGSRNGLTQSELRQWMKDSAPFRSLTLLCHPADRAWAAFSRLFIDGADPALAALIRRQWAIPLSDPSDPAALKAAFRAFLVFLKASLSGQTNLRVDPAWASQSAHLQGFSQFAVPDVILRPQTLESGLRHLCADLGLDCPPVECPRPGVPENLRDDDIARLLRQACARDYVAFGFRDWPPVA
ncbi:MAG: nodulation protein NodH [Proteobacteria bacterium]|nr:nodulation protein NodH [Pseudomonadota bacterium]MBS0574027.1 nodulation protein NodH [Pseudomonadota bacterium]